MKLGSLILCLPLVCAPPEQAAAWGASGHSIVAEIAQRRLTPDALREMKALLGGEISLASIASWADSVEVVRPETINWHFVNIPFEARSYEPDRDCKQTSRGDCVVNAIGRFTMTLADRTAPNAKRAEALTFLVHLVADVHQPMHCINRNDAGGSMTQVEFFDTPMSLHAVWDFAILDKHTYDWGQIVREVESDELPRLDARVLPGQPEDWALESHEAAVKYGYALPPDLKLADAYYRQSLPVVSHRLALAAARLALLLNEALSGRDIFHRPAENLGKK